MGKLFFAKKLIEINVQNLNESKIIEFLENVSDIYEYIDEEIDSIRNFFIWTNIFWLLLLFIIIILMENIYRNKYKRHVRHENAFKEDNNTRMDNQKNENPDIIKAVEHQCNQQKNTQKMIYDMNNEYNMKFKDFISTNDKTRDKVKKKLVFV